MKHRREEKLEKQIKGLACSAMFFVFAIVVVN